MSPYPNKGEHTRINEYIVNGSDFFVIGVKYPISNYTYCMINTTNSSHQLYKGNIFNDVIENFKNALFYKFINVIIETLLAQVRHMVFHDSIRKLNSTLITLILKI